MPDAKARRDTPDRPPMPKWKRELYLLRRDGFVKYLRVLYLLRRFHRSVRRMESGRR